MAEGSLITEEMRAAIGREGEPTVHEVEKGAIRRFAEAIGDPNPLFYDEEYAKTTKYGGIIAPPTFLCSLISDRPTNLNLPFKRRLNGGNEFELFQPLRPGDVLTSRSKIVDFFEREGRLGRMVMMVTDTVYTNLKGEIVGRMQATGIMY